jgi:hypothetical protein
VTVYAFGSAKGSPGVTTTVAALASAWPADRGVLVVEADPGGGDLAARVELAADPGLVTLAAQGRRSLDVAALDTHTQELPGLRPARALLGVPSADQAHAALRAVRGRFPEVLGEVADADVLVDCGRLDPASPALELVATADVAVIVTRPRLDHVQHVAARVMTLAADPPPLVLPVGDRPYGPGEIAAATGVGVLGVLADDGRATGVLNGTVTGGAWLLPRSRLIRSARTLADALVRIARLRGDLMTGESGASTGPQGRRAAEHAERAAAAGPPQSGMAPAAASGAMGSAS